ncbi:MAG: CoA transferase subunit A [Clostridia bacterium]|nr:CoA transferase subunit A [Clostridia bacterium]
MQHNQRRATNKQMTLAEAVSRFVFDGATLTFGGFIGRDCVAVVHEIVRQGKKDLTVIDDSKTDITDILVGAGLLKKWEGAYFGYGALGLAPNFRRSIEQGIPYRVEVEDWTNAAISMRFLAAALNLPFMPTRSMLGSDILKYNQKVKVIQDPFEGQPLALVPAARPDVAFIHVQRADITGNGQIWGFTGSDENKVRAAKRVVLTCEEIVPPEEIKRQANLTAIPFYCVDAVVHVPFGCHPQSCYGYYAYDVLFCGQYHEMAKTREGFLAWLDTYVYGCRDHQEYCAKVGWDRLFALQHLERQFNRLPA